MKRIQRKRTKKIGGICKCGHDKQSHAISMKGVVGSCMKEIIKNWEWCECKKFTPKFESGTRTAERKI